MEQNKFIGQVAAKPEAEPDVRSIGQGLKKIPNTLLIRLIDEVKNESQNGLMAYNRTHNRHNRGR